jgi:adenosylhomocysteinase
MTGSDQIEAYYSHLVTQLERGPGTDVVAVAHMVPNTLTFVPAVNDLARVAVVLPKPKSELRPEFAVISSKFATLKLSREWARDASRVVSDLEAKAGDRLKSLVLLDIGGYFAESINQLADILGERFLGVLEGTENGVQRYEEYIDYAGPYKVPVVTVARSPLKLPEDYLVASSIVFSIEATLRQEAEILQTRSAAVIGYGRVGSAVAEILRERGISTVVHDSDPTKLAAAAARGFKACRRLSNALEHATLVVCATGKKSLDLAGFGCLVQGCVVASSTSADDEFDLPALAPGYRAEELNSRLTRYVENRAGGRYVFLVAGGNAANFLDGAVIGPAMQLIEGEKLAAIKGLMDGEFSAGNGISEVSRAGRRAVAEIWNHHFLL